MFHGLVQDARLALRLIRRSPSFAAVVIGTMALAIGANTAVFSIFNALVLKPVPVREPSRLVVLTPIEEPGTATRFIYEATVERLRASQQVFDRLSMFSGGGALRAEVRGVASDAGVEGVEPEYFDLVGARPAIGRLLIRDDSLGRTGAPSVVISNRFWLQQFGGDPHAIGESIRIDGTPMTVVGVMEPGFRGLQADNGADLFMTMATLRPIAGDMTRPLRARNVLARLRAGTPVEAARAQLLARWPALVAADVPGLPALDLRALRAQRVSVESIATGFSPLRQRYADSVVLLLGLTALLLAIGCANLSGLLLARAAARGDQVAVRAALGASRARLAQHMLVEAAVLSALGTAAAVPLAWWATRLIQRLLTAGSLTSPALSMAPDARVLAGSALVAVATGLLVGVLPAWRASRTRAAFAGDSPRLTAAMPATARVLVIAQIALSLVLLIAASLFTQSMMRLHANDPGSQPSSIVWARLWLKPEERGANIGTAYWRDLAGRFQTIPGVDSVAYAFYFPAALGATPTIERISRADGVEAAEDVEGFSDIISPRFFQTLGFTLLKGRDVSWFDAAESPPVAIVTAALATKLFGGRDPIGQHLRLRRDPARPIEIVGVAADAAFGNIHDPKPAVLFRPMTQAPSQSRVPNAIVRGRGDVSAIREAYTRVADGSAHHFVRSVYRLDEWVDQTLLRERLVAWLSSFFAGLAVLLSCLGIYGLLAYAVSRRTREIGVRMALGATPQSVLRSFARDGLLVGAAGIAVGIPCALAAGRLVRSLLYDLAPNDPLTIALTSTALIAVAVLAGLIPAYRASTTDPMAALRCE